MTQHNISSADKLRYFLVADNNEKFPYRLYIEEEMNKFLQLRVQDRWPGPGKKIFCLPEGYCSIDNLKEIKPIESCGIVSVKRSGKKLNIILDRKKNKRCWFVFLKKEYKTKPGEFYEQVFWVTQSSAKIRRPGAYIPQGSKKEPIFIVSDKREKYAYRFPKAEVIKENLPVGDYGLKIDGKLIAIAERKTIDNLLHEIATYDVLKLQLQELNSFEYKAVVFEAPYSDFINPKKLKAYNASYISEIIADLFVSFPEIQFVFCDNRKIAAEWIYRWFTRIQREYRNKYKNE
ncbi:MAG: ERCC4 domain-containing protein [Endomicrobiia bacterium]